MAKIVIIGNSEVGKTSLRKKYLGQGFQKNHLPTMGADFAAKDAIIDDKTVKLQIWDIAGQPSFKFVRKRFYSKTAGAFVVFDLTEKDSYRAIGDWIGELWKTLEGKKIPIVIVGNKVDLINKENRIIGEDDVNKFINAMSSKNNIDRDLFTYIETSALSGVNVDDAFIDLSKKIMSNIDKQNAISN